MVEYCRNLTRKTWRDDHYGPSEAVVAGRDLLERQSLSTVSKQSNELPAGVRCGISKPLMGEGTMVNGVYGLRLVKKSRPTRAADAGTSHVGLPTAQIARTTPFMQVPCCSTAASI